ncbi:MAG: DUF3168 domain-containing protein [Sphingomonadaceae bacterium]|nr:DUF3168 domain-containing protein [Sphingomonadaceae bacterium]
MRAALFDAVEGHAALRGAINGVYFETPERASVPYALIGELAARDWGTKDARGREARLSVTIVEDAVRGARLVELVGEAEAAIEAMPREIGAWRVASLAFVRSAVLAAKGGERRAVVEYRVRVLEI